MIPLERDELVGGLQRFDFSREGAAVYLELLRGGPRKASVLADATGHHRTKIYRLLDELVRRDAVRASVERPTIYSPQPPHRVLEEVLRTRSSHLRSLSRLQASLEASLEDLKRAEAPDVEHEPDWRVLHGRGEILEALAAMAKRADTTLRVLCNHGPSLRSTPRVEEVWETLGHRAAAGVALQALLAGDGGTLERLTPEPVPAVAEVRALGQRPTVHAALADDREVLLWLVFDPSTRTNMAEDAALWTDAPGLVAAQSLLFQELWDDAGPDAGEDGS